MTSDAADHYSRRAERVRFPTLIRTRASIQADIQLLQLLGPSRADDQRLGLSSKLKRFLNSIGKRIEKGEKYEAFSSIIEAICLSYSAGWLVLGRWHLEQGTDDGYGRAKEELQRFLENSPQPDDAAMAWKLLASACYKTGDNFGEVHAFVERADTSDISFNDLSSTANKVNQLRITLDSESDQKQDWAKRALLLMEQRIDEAGADDLARMGWMALALGDKEKAKDFLSKGLNEDSTKHSSGHLRKKI